MNIKSKLLTVTALVLSTSVNATLLERLGGLAYYDDVSGLTWLADANAFGDSMTWDDANTWAAGLDVAGVTGWQLADTIQPDLSCTSQALDGSSFGYSCTGSAMGNLFYNVLGGSAGSSIITTHNDNYDLFSNIQSSYYWTATESAVYTDYAWEFNMEYGTQDFDRYKYQYNYAWAVYSGDVGVGPVPVPAALWLFSSGLIGLVGLARRKKA